MMAMLAKRARTTLGAATMIDTAHCGEPPRDRKFRWHLISSSCNPRLLAATFLWFGLSLCGCSKSDPYFHVAGKVTFNGQPVPAGEVQMMPDSTKGNRGPSVMASIKDGQYATRAGRGIVGGHYILMITGFQAAPYSTDPTAPGYGKKLFDRTKQSFEFPKEDCTHDIRIENSSI